MNEKQVKETVENILDNSPVGVMATVRNNRPHARYMTFFRQGLKLYTATNKETDKVDEIEDIPYTNILIGYEGEGFGDEYVEYAGEVTISHSEDLKDALWNEYIEAWFSGRDDPNFIVLEINPTRIHLMNKTGTEPKVLTL